jgi:hypothetical protein
MPPRRDPTDDRDLNTQVAVIIEKMKNLENLASATAQDMRTMKDANFIRTVDMNLLVDKLQGSFATKNEIDDVRRDVDSLKGDRSKIGWFIILAVLGSGLTLILNSAGKLHF